MNVVRRVGQKAIYQIYMGLGSGCRVAILVCVCSGVSGVETVRTELEGSAQVYCV